MSDQPIKRKPPGSQSAKSWKKPKPSTTVPRLWSKDEEEKLATYFAEHPYLGKDQAKETFANYLRKLLRRLEINDCDYKQVSNKYTQMKKKYEATRKWVDETGQGVRDGDPETFRGKVEQLCHYYYIVDEVWGASQAVNTSYQRDSGTSTFGQDIDIILEEDQALQGEVDTVTQFESRPDDQGEEVSDKLADTSSVESTAKEGLQHSATKFEIALSSRNKSNPKGGNGTGRILQFLEERQEMRSKTEDAKINLEREKFMQEQQTLIQLKEMELSTELRKTELTKEVELKRLEVEDNKTKLEMLKLQCDIPHLKFN